MYFDFSELSAAKRDKLLHSTIVPRPIAWISSVNAEGKRNLAPFSFFNVFASDPPFVAVGVGRLGSGIAKHTSRNIRETGEFVVNLVSFSIREQMNISALDTDEDEIALARLTPLPSRTVAPPRIAESPVAMECKLEHAIPLSDNEFMLIGRVFAMHIDDRAILDAERCHVNTPALDLIARMHGNGWYVRTNELFQMPRL